MQTKLGSLTEVVVSTTIGYTVALATQLLVFPVFGVYVPLETNVTLAVIFTFISVVRGYFVRRLFNKWSK